MKTLSNILFILVFFSYANAQTNTFPENWKGKWKGDLKIYSLDKNKIENSITIPMELEIYKKENNLWS